MSEEQKANISKYLEGKLSGEDLAEFEQEVEQNAELKSALETALLSQYAVYHSARDKEVETLTQQLPPEDPAKTRPLYRRYAYIVAAGIAVFLLAYFLIQPPTQQLNTEELYAAYYQPLKASTTRAQSASDLLKNADLAYNQQRFEDAIINYQGYLDEGNVEEADRAMLFQGISFMETGNFADAAATLSSISDEQGSGPWFLALCYLKLQNTDKARQLLGEIASQKDHFYSQKAQEALEQWKE